AKRLLERAASLSPDYSAPRAWLAKYYLFRIVSGWSQTRERDYRAAARHAAAALALDSTDALAVAIHAHTRSFLYRDYEQARAELIRALSGAPSHALAWSFSALTHSYLGEADLAAEHAAYGIRLSPRDPYRFYQLMALGLAHFVAGRDAAAVEALDESARAAPTHAATLRFLICSLQRAGRGDDAQAVAARLVQANPDFKVSAYRNWAPFPALLREEMAGLLRQAGVPE
ncbi:MAG: hypothetical protein KIT16_24405, partial [Rhodospirillaceae bacterium]|nr:hypothetical protein [Rhodospirillaceae bacterium]